MTAAQRLYQIAGAVLFGVAVYLAYASLQMRYFTSLGPGPGFFPLWLSIALGALALGMVAQATFGRPEPLPADFFPDRAGYLRILAILAALVGAALGLGRLGFSLTMFLANVFVLVALGRRQPLGILIMAASGSFGVYYLFTRWLSVPLPAGPYGF